MRTDAPNPATLIIAYERAGSHDGDWINVLFLNGDAEGAPASGIHDAMRKRANENWRLPEPE